IVSPEPPRPVSAVVPAVVARRVPSPAVAIPVAIVPPFPTGLPLTPRALGPPPTLGPTLTLAFDASLTLDPPLALDSSLALDLPAVLRPVPAPALVFHGHGWCQRNADHAREQQCCRSCPECLHVVTFRRQA